MRIVGACNFTNIQAWELKILCWSFSQSTSALCEWRMPTAHHAPDS